LSATGRGRARSLVWLGRALLDLALPPLCALCDREATVHGLCTECWRRIQRTAPEDPPAPAPLRGWATGAWYDGEWQGWMRRYKYPESGLRGLDPAALCVVRALTRLAVARAAGPAPDLVVPVPQHPTRLRERGFSPAAGLARCVARETRAALGPSALLRRVATPSQTGLSRSERRRNLSGAIVAAGALPRRIWIVDDVVTTGATLREAARAARSGGARDIVAIAAVRTPLVERGGSHGYLPAPGPELGTRKEPQMATINQAVTLKHQANLGEEIAEVAFEAGSEITVLKEWNDRYLCKNDAGQVFNVPKEYVDS